MEIEILKEVVGVIGFPASCVIGLGLYITKRDKQHVEERREERVLLLDEIKFNREVNAQLLETNKLLASDIKVELQDIKSEIKHINRNEVE